MNSWDQKKFSLKPRARGCYLVTDEVLSNVPEICTYTIGQLTLFLQHTSAGLTLNENWDRDVRKDMSSSLDRVVPEGDFYVHSDEGPDDMPGHVKSTIVGVTLTIPISNGKLCLGTWQGIWLCEFRDYEHTRWCVATVNGLKEAP
ncbi:hypothetical protein BABINDRAFT_161065 [Babjeviella inositovora NRRL Y-12698]|uniref:Secondary thiamine-phosphate synthase enzyme n=1 Tax=Babjeviella inositovora NRRL Y-12698 TaxID=984486 RepID=A0A1E3QT61_9ASCO|nr:uncharacterized protein BABINDRAFT_161065 [Babjeviella inositovora NRRL Y-12698]ODQ80871.1 hypothetical protein BABINDRAFT_161065 [Babjeviella inositovora NRRL Y-12698]